MNQKKITAGTSSHHWYALRVRAKFESVASLSLSSKGYEQFLPLYRLRRKWSDRSRDLHLPLFPGYLFCRVDINDRLLPVLMSPGVISIVGFGRTAAVIPDHEIEAIRAVTRSGLHSQPWPRLAVGSTVVIDKGPLAGIEGITLDVNKTHRLIISIPLLQRSVAVEIDRLWVHPLSTDYRRYSAGTSSTAIRA